MCGRYVLHGPQSRYLEHFGTEGGFDLPPRFNVAPSQLLPVIRQDADGLRRFVMAHWGLIPSWIKDSARLNRPINARAETAATRPMFRHAFRKGRVLVPADGFYEWKALVAGKQAYLIRMRDRLPFAMAGLLESWQGPEGEIQTFAILTTAANPLMAPIHDRMPAIIRPEDYASWLDPAKSALAALAAMLGPYPDKLMDAYPVGRQVNSPANDGPGLLERAEEEA